MKKIILIICILLFHNIYVFAAEKEIEIVAALDKNSIVIGDTVLLTLKIQSSEKIELVEEKIPAALGEFEIIDITVSQINNIKTLNIVGSIYNSGDFSIPQMQINYKLYNDTAVYTAHSDTLNISVIPIKVDMSGEIKDYAAPKLKKYDYSGIIILSLIIIAAVIILIVIIKFLKKYFKKNIVVREIETAKTPAWEIARIKLLKLKNIEFNTKEDYKFFAFELSYLIREFIGELYNIDCLESSNTELKAKIKNIEFPQKEIFIEINDFLEPVKYAKFKPPLKTIEMYIEMTEKFISANTVIEEL